MSGELSIPVVVNPSSRDPFVKKLGRGSGSRVRHRELDHRNAPVEKSSGFRTEAPRIESDFRYVELIAKIDNMFRDLVNVDRAFRRRSPDPSGRVRVKLDRSVR